MTQKGNGGEKVAHAAGAPVTAYFYSTGLASSELLRFTEITNTRVDPED